MFAIELAVILSTQSLHLFILISTFLGARSELKGTELLLKTIRRVKERANRGLKIAGIVPTLHDSRTVQAQMSLESIQQQLAKLGSVYPPISRSVAFVDSSQEHLPLALYNRSHPALKILTEIANHLIEVK